MGAAAGPGGDSGGGPGEDIGQDDTLGELDAMPATADDFGPASGFGLGSLEAAQEAAAANSFAGIGDSFAITPDMVEKAYQTLPNEKSYLGLLGLFNLLNPSKMTPGFNPNAKQPTVGFGVPTDDNPNALAGWGIAPANSLPDDGGLGGGDGLLRLAQSSPFRQAGSGILNAPSPIPTYTPPQYQFLNNWWEGNDFIPAPLTRI